MADTQVAPPPVVSIWVGTFSSIDDAEAYFFKDASDGSASRCRFADDFALDAFDPACVEIRFERRLRGSRLPFMSLIADLSQRRI